jgi:hypothetical protein
VTAGATIYYTTNGDSPTTSSAIYSAPISVTATQTIKAIATKAAHIASGEASFQYTISAPQPIYKHSFTKAIGGVQASISASNISGGVIEAGDTLVAVVMTRSDVTSVSPGTWTRLGSSSGVQRAYLQRVSVYYKTATGNPAVDNTVTVNQVDSARIILSVLVFRGLVEPRDIQSGAASSDCDRVGFPAIATLGALEVPVYTYTNAFTYTDAWGNPAAEVATFYNQADAADPNLSKDAPAGNNRMTVAIGQMGTNSQITSAGFNSCGVGLSQQGMRFVVSKPANNILTYEAGWTGTGTAANPLSPTNVTYNGGYLGGGNYPVFNSASFTAAIGGTLRITHPGFLIDCDCDGGKGIAINGTVVQGWGMSCSAHPPPNLIFTTLTRTVTAGQTIQFTGIDCYWSAYDKQFRVWIEPN